MRLLGLFLAVAVAGSALVAVQPPGRPAGASGGPCDPRNPEVSAVEAELLALVNGWRAANLGAPAMPLSEFANAAAQWFAEAMIAGTTSGHVDQYGRTWGERLEDCGFPGVSGVTFGSGEALAGFGSSDPGFGSTPEEALALMVGNPAVSNAVNAPVGWACAGVGYASNSDPAIGDLRYAWVVVTVQVFGECPAAPATPAASPAPTATPAPTSTATPPPSPSPPVSTPTPDTRPVLRSAIPLLVREQ